MSERTPRPGERGYTSQYGPHDMRGRTSAKGLSWRFWALVVVYEIVAVGLVWYGVTHQA